MFFSSYRKTPEGSSYLEEETVIFRVAATGLMRMCAYVGRFALHIHSVSQGDSASQILKRHQTLPSASTFLCQVDVASIVPHNPMDFPGRRGVGRTGEPSGTGPTQAADNISAAHMVSGMMATDRDRNVRSDLPLSFPAGIVKHAVLYWRRSGQRGHTG